MNQTVRLSPTLRLGGMARDIDSILDGQPLDVVATEMLPAVAPRYAPIPSRLHDKVRNRLEASFPEGFFTHQASAIDAVLDGEHVCLATPTASGKSGVFMSATVSRLLEDPSRRVLALYPLKALIGDQVAKWEAALEGTGLSVGRIDGSVPVRERAAILASSHVVAMTPDVFHAWCMPRVGESEVARFMRSLAFLILDEAHVYDGVFGSNVAFLLRRARAHAPAMQVIAATATVGDPATLVKRLSGCEPTVFGPDEDGSGRYARDVVVASPHGRLSAEDIGRVVASVAEGYDGRFLVFLDSRQGVERIGAAAQAALPDDAEERGISIMTTRAGHDDAFRTEVLRDLASGKLRGVVTTSALEMGIDIGPIDLVICVGVPFTAKSFWQRLGRAGRRSASTCLIIDTDGRLASRSDLNNYLAQDPEPSWLYLDNRCLQYAQAICAAQEMKQAGRELDGTDAFDDLPESFRQLLTQELDGGQFIPQDLYHLKTRSANTTPQLEFPIRMSAEQNFTIQSGNQRLGSITYAQLMREAYPGATYLHQMRRYAVTHVDARRAVVKVRPSRQAPTRPVAMSTVFPNYRSGVLRARVSSRGFVAEVEIQATDCVTGFTQHSGSERLTHEYTAGSPFRQQPLNRFVESTGICLCFPELGFSPSRWAELATLIATAACTRLSLHPGDVDSGRFHSREPSFGLEGPLKGGCIFDGTYGSLRLTGRVFDVLEDLLGALAEELLEEGRLDDASDIERLAGAIADTADWSADRSGAPEPTDDGWVVVLAPGARGMLRTGAAFEEVRVRDVLYTPNGVMYELESPPPTPGAAPVRRLVRADTVERLNGDSELRLFDPCTAEFKEIA